MEQIHRNIIKFGELQIKVCKKSGTLLRKKKYVFEEEQWVALCVHDQKVPLLEWYCSKDEIFNHEPFKLLDLLNCMFINSAFGDDRCFIISFVDEKRTPLEFGALSTIECTDWITSLKTTLKSLNCLSQDENCYVEFKEKQLDTNHTPAISPIMKILLVDEEMQGSDLTALPVKSASLVEKNPLSLTLSKPTRSRTLCLTNEIPMQTSLPIVIASRTNDLHENLASNSLPKKSFNSIEQLNDNNAQQLQPTSIHFLLNKSPEMIDSFRQMPSSLSTLPMQHQQQTSLASSPLRVISYRLQQQHIQKLGESLNAAHDLLPPLPPRKSQTPLSPSFIGSNEKTDSLENNININLCERDLESQYDDFTSLPHPNYDQLISKDYSEPNYDLFTLPINICNTNSSSERNLSSQSDEISQIRLSGVFLPESNVSWVNESHQSNPNSFKDTMTSSLDLSNNQMHNSMEYDFPSSPPIINSLLNFNNTFREALNKSHTIPLLLTVCVEHIAFVEVGDKIWIAGWNSEKDNYLRNLIHFGDEVLQIGSELVKSIHQIPSLFYTQSVPGTPIDVKIRSIPNGSVYSITKDINAKKSLGIVLHKKKNRIASIEDKSPAWHAQVPKKLPPYVYGASDIPAVVTEVEGIPLNPFAKNEQLFQRLQKFTPGSSINIIVQPRDLIKLIKSQLKLHKNYKRFLHDS